MYPWIDRHGIQDVFRLDTVWPGWTALHLAAAHGLEEAMRFFFSVGLPWNSKRHMAGSSCLYCSLQPKKTLGNFQVKLFENRNAKGAKSWNLMFQSFVP